MLKWISLLCLGYLFLVGIFYIFQRQFIYQPHSGEINPKKLGLPTVKLIQLKTSDGVLLDAWFHPAKNDDTPTIVYFHGNAGNLGHRADRVSGFVNTGYGLLLLSYRGYGGNKGSPTEKNLYIDARAAIHFLQSKKVRMRCIVLLGESLGSGVAVQMATEFPVGAVVLQSAYTSIIDVGKKHYPFLPVRWLLKDHFESINKIREIQAPILFIHGGSDFIVPATLGKKLYFSANEPKAIKIYEGAGHNDLPDVTDIVIQFLKMHPICCSLNDLTH